MSRVSREDTPQERIVYSFLRANRIRFRRNLKRLPGSPDIVLPDHRTVIFVHGCFWHGHKNCRLARRPKTNKEYWYRKIDENIERDKKKSRELRKLGWRVFTVWQCQITSAKSEKTLKRLVTRIDKAQPRDLPSAGRDRSTLLYY
ncbi:MAG: DNA mismatch endonuclease Vsr [Bacteroidetes bacterium]|nr:DNA mismatch endonuclease Vsr [Bacteroidota bacterium]